MKVINAMTGTVLESENELVTTSWAAHPERFTVVADADAETKTVAEDPAPKKTRRTKATNINT